MYCWILFRVVVVETDKKKLIEQTTRKTKTYTDKEVINRARRDRPTDCDFLEENDYVEVSMPGHWFEHALETVQKCFVFESIDKSIDRSVRVST